MPALLIFHAILSTLMPSGLASVCKTDASEFDSRQSLACLSIRSRSPTWQRHRSQEAISASSNLAVSMTQHSDSLGSVAQLAEAMSLSLIQCGFDSRCCYGIGDFDSIAIKLNIAREHGQVRYKPPRSQRGYRGFKSRCSHLLLSMAC